MKTNSHELANEIKRIDALQKQVTQLTTKLAELSSLVAELSVATRKGFEKTIGGKS